MERLKIGLVFFLLIWLSLIRPAKDVFCQAVYVPINHDAYRFIERMETRHILVRVLNSTKPLSRKEMAEYLLQVREKANNGANLSRVEKDWLEFLLNEFRAEVIKIGESLPAYETRIDKIKHNKFIKKIFPGILYQNGKNFYSWCEDDVHIFFDPVYRYQVQVADSSSIVKDEVNYHFTNGFQVWGYLNKHLGFWVDFRDNKEWGSRKYKIGNYTLPGLGFVRATSPDFIYHDETQAYVKLAIKNFQFLFGKFENYWGNGISGSLILSNYATSYDQFKFEFKHKKFKFTSIYAQLIDYHYHIEDSLQQKKYLAAHRLETTPLKWLNIGISETVIFKGRSFEPAYLNPVMFFRSAEHYLGSPDNMMMSLDFKINAIRNWKLYGELLIDDLTTSKLGTNWFGNKYGFLCGIFFASPFQTSNVDFRLEYARLRPYVYSHLNSLQYTHYASNLGHWIGPNSDLFTGIIKYQPTRRLVLQGSYFLHRKGENTQQQNFGGDIETPWTVSDDLYPEFLGGNKIIKHNFGVQFSCEVLRNLFFRLNIYKEFIAIDYLEKRRKKINSLSIFSSLGINY